MALNSLNDPTQLINLQIKSQEHLGDILAKAKNLLDIAINSELLDYPANTAYCYFSAVSDFLHKATDIHESILMTLMENYVHRVTE